MKILSVRKEPKYARAALQYIQSKWAKPETLALYEDCIMNCLPSRMPLPQWYLLMEEDAILGCAGLIPNDFISRMDLYPWVCALYIEETFRGHQYGALLLEQAKKDAKAAGFSHLYLCTDLTGYYEHYGFQYIGMGYHPWGDSSRIYTAAL